MAATANSNDTAASRAFNTTELLEAILLELDMRDLLLSQRVAKRWRDTITGSQSLQEALFFRQVVYWGGMDLGTEGVNTLAISNVDLSSDRGLRLTTRTNVCCTLNCWYAGAYQGSDMYDLEAGVETTTGSPAPQESDYVRPSWLDMYLTQPVSAMSARIVYHFKTKGGGSDEDREEEGMWDDEARHWRMTMEEICEMMVEMVIIPRHDSGGPAPP